MEAPMAEELGIRGGERSNWKKSLYCAERCKMESGSTTTPFQVKIISGMNDTYVAKSTLRKG